VGTSGVASSFAGLLRLAAWVICLIVIASFVVFAVDQTGNASTHQQNVLNGNSSEGVTTSSPSHKSGLHKALDETADALTSPFAGVVSGSSQWAIHIVRTVLALLVYGFGLGYLARVLRVRV
jgi:hypothetical protein